MEITKKLRWQYSYQTKARLKTKFITKDKAECYIIIKGSIQEENICAVNMGAPKYIKQVLTETKEIDSSTIIVGNFNTLLISMDRSSRQNINNKTMTLNDILGQIS